MNPGFGRGADPRAILWPAGFVLTKESHAPSEARSRLGRTQEERALSETPDRAPSGKSRTSGDPRPYVILVGLCLFTVGCGDNIFPGLVNAVANVLSSDAPLSPVDSVDVPGVGADSQSPGANGVVPVNGGTGSDTHTPNTTGSGNSTLAQGTSSPPTFNPGNIFGPVTLPIDIACWMLSSFTRVRLPSVNWLRSTRLFLSN